MAIIKPFKALKPKKELAEQVASRPYDVLNSEEAKKEAAGNNYSFLRITKSEIDLPNGIDTNSQQVYDKAKTNLELFIQNGTLYPEEKPCYYIYQLVMNGKSQTGLVCVSSVEDYFKDVIKKHELTRPEKEKDALINELKAKNSPEYDFTANDGIKHTGWVINRDDVINSITNLFATKV